MRDQGDAIAERLRQALPSGFEVRFNQAFGDQWDVYYQMQYCGGFCKDGGDVWYRVLPGKRKEYFTAQDATAQAVLNKVLAEFNEILQQVS
jgi:hypothetical protein